MAAELKNHFTKIMISERSRGSEIAENFIRFFEPEKIFWVDEKTLMNLQHKGQLSSQQFSKSKHEILIKPFDGQFFKRCPGATQKKALACCNYYVLNLGSQCHFNCSYCYLQSYINSPWMIVYSNVDAALSEIETMATQHPDHPFRIGTGEMIDSLGLDPITQTTARLIQLFQKFPKWTLELKTKSSFVEQFLQVPHCGNVVVSWSINSETIINKEEYGTARLEERLQAAQKCVLKGFKIAFHIDPMIYYPSWKEDYAHLVELITARFTPDQVSVISVGSLRFQPEQRHMMKERFGLQSFVTSSEVFQSDTGKMRYDSILRQGMFSSVVNQFKANSTDWKVFMCMETPETWLGTFNSMPMQNPELKELFRPLPKIQNSTY